MCRYIHAYDIYTYTYHKCRQTDVLGVHLHIHSNIHIHRYECICMYSELKSFI